MMLCCLSLQSHLFSPVFYQQPSASSPVCCTVKYCCRNGIVLAVTVLCPCSVGHLLYDPRCRGAGRQPHDGKHLSCDLIGETQTDCSTILTGRPTSHTNTHIDPHVSTKGVGVMAHDLTRATIPHVPFLSSLVLTRSLLFYCWSRSRAAWAGSVGCGCGFCCRGVGLDPEWCTEASCARSSSSGPPSQSHPSPSTPAPSHARLQLC